MWLERKLQGLKPADFISFVGTTEVVPCYKAISMELSSSLLRLLHMIF